MGKSIRSKREKRLRAIRRELVEPIYEKKEAAKFAAPKLPVKPPRSDADIDASPSNPNALDVEMEEMDDASQSTKILKPIGKKMKKKIKIAKRKHHIKGKIRKKNNV